MNHPLRRRHRRVFVALAFLLPLILMIALAGREDAAVVDLPGVSGSQR